MKFASQLTQTASTRTVAKIELDNNFVRIGVMTPAQSKKSKSQLNGYSLTELLVVLALLGVLSAVALSTLYPVMMTMLYGG